MRSIVRQLELPLPTSAAFALLHTPSAIRQWWSAARVVVTPRLGGLWIAAWGSDEDAPDYVTVARILVWDPPNALRLGEFEYITREGGGLPFTAALETEFLVRGTPTGSVLQVCQTGFPEDSVADAFHAACERGWAATFEGIERFVEVGRRSLG
jgi:uncharacterized protein YndB with AHSA1/START domain